MRQLNIVTKLTNRDNESLKQYFKEISVFQRFTPEEEAKCAKKAQLGDLKALNELINRNLRFVVSVAKQYENKDVQLSDLINEGNMGLIAAAKRFNPDLGFKFISFSVWWIRKYITEYLTNSSRAVRIPSNVVNNLHRLNQKMAILEQKLGRTIDIDDVIKEYPEISIDELKSINLTNTMKMDSLDRDISSDGEGVSLSEIINDDSYYTPSDQLVNNSDTSIKIGLLLKSLTEREKFIIVSLFGLDGNEPKTLGEVAETLSRVKSVTKEAIRLTKEKILRKLKIKTKNFEYLSKF